MSSARCTAIAWDLLARSRDGRHGMDLQLQLGPMETERVLRGRERDRASPVNGEHASRSMSNAFDRAVEQIAARVGEVIRQRTAPAFGRTVAPCNKGA